MKAFQLIALLQEHDLYQSNSLKSDDVSFESLAYDSRNVSENGLFICKGKNFSVDYLKQAIANGATSYLAETDYSDVFSVPGIIVNDVRKAMSLAAQLFFGFPQNDLFLIGYTGTKGKTTSTYFTHNILEHAHPGEVAMFSTIDRIVGQGAKNQFKAHLTTAESFDLFKEMREAVDNGAKYLVMEVASQAYLLDRVYGLQFDVGIFLDITPDHIGINEHPNFANYLFCKQQLLLNSRNVVINADTDHFDEVLAAAQVSTAPDHIFTYGMNSDSASVSITDNQASLTASTFNLVVNSDNPMLASLAQTYNVSVPGDFNQSNASAAILATAIAGASADDMQYGLANTKVPGRMQFTRTKNHGTIYVDYAHDWGSMNALLGFLSTQFPDQRVIAVLGSTGDKGEDRREGFARALNDFADVAYLTADDPGHEDPIKIAEEIDSHIDHSKVDTTIVPKREDAIRQAITGASNTDLVVLAGKGEDKYQKVNGVDTPYPSDPVVAANVLESLADEA
ncbi:UDP-N-acetylmuramoylalanyl-D-glutamate--2,6-diaminopimelate ligase [Levilactobacillus paucivorans]|uniref:UDP-N-acetylmuramyl-tripeptide synthetase n=1 Tax=Levilactobacillus paucivorans TaxID=616990 RepID=A0A0R2LLH8_9LACO|nr:UDP-N-acetylmuramoyl-L-alanyl-D-glutamate--2,6-diaminopimelate ligase [Levilactobacillus paucivorans]KRN99060.1 UDP-N-acetylmuramoylalanyl-D-glutamate--2,6-diaminopimelate ligase [Levilactobacillus paucivorans]